MALVSVLTAVHQGGGGYLRQAADAVLGQVLAPGWELEWVVQEDGPQAGDPSRYGLPADERIRFEPNGAQLGAALTRNLGLARTRGELMQNLDADDVLLPGSLAYLVALFESHPELHWALGQADDLLPDGSRRPYHPDLPFGRVEAGRVGAWAREHAGNWPLHCAGMMYRTASMRALGGWGGLPYDEDLALFGALSELTPGWFTKRLTWLYRRHAGQMTRSSASSQWSHVGRSIVLQRVSAVRAVQLQLHGSGLGWDDVPSAGPSRHSGSPAPRPS